MNETSTQRRAETRSRTDRAADGRHAPSVPAQAGSVRPGAGRIWGLIGLVALTAVTSLVVATISTWLVPVYMAVMALIFATPRPPRPAGEPTTTENAPAARPEDAEPPRAADIEGPTDEGAEAVAEPPAPAEATEPAPAKPRKRRAKGKRAGKAAQAAEALASEPTWIRVGPGKFVRADVQAAPPDAEDRQASASEPEAGTATDAEPATLTAADLQIEAEATFSEDVVPDVAGEAVEPQTQEDATPASSYGAEPSEVISPASFVDDEAETTEPDEEYGIAPSALAGDFNEEYGIAPSALVETWEPEALLDDDADDEPEPTDGATGPEMIAEAEEWSEVAPGIADEVDVEATAHASEPTPAALPEPIAAPATVASPSPERLAPGATAACPKGTARTPGLGLIRRSSRLRERHDRPRTPRHRDAVARPTRSGRTDRVRVRGTERGRRRSDTTGRRPHPRSPPRRP